MQISFWVPTFFTLRNLNEWCYENENFASCRVSGLIKAFFLKVSIKPKFPSRFKPHLFYCNWKTMYINWIYQKNLNQKYIITDAPWPSYSFSCRVSDGRKMRFYAMNLWYYLQKAWYHIFIRGYNYFFLQYNHPDT